MAGSKQPIFVMHIKRKDNPPYDIAFAATRDALDTPFSQDMYLEYTRTVSDDCYMFEDVVHKLAVSRFEAVGTSAGLIVMYDDLTINITFVLDSVDERTKLTSPYFSEDLEYQYSNDYIKGRLDKFKIDDNNELWQYLIYSNEPKAVS